MRIAVRKMGNSAGFIIPKTILDEVQASVGSDFDIAVVAGRIVISKPETNPREGWEEDARALVAAGEGGLVWPEFGNRGDDELVW